MGYLCFVYGVVGVVSEYDDGFGVWHVVGGFFGWFLYLPSYVVFWVCVDCLWCEDAD